MKRKILKPKVAIVGAGNVGASFAYALLFTGLAREIVLIDKNIERAKGEAMDLNHSVSFYQPVKISWADFKGCADSEIVVITAGAKQLVGQSRLDLVTQNSKIFKEMISKIVKAAPRAILLVVTNPVDILTYITYKLSGFPAKRVIGSGTVLDTARFRHLLSEHCKVDPRNVHAYIIGEHGDSEFAVWSSANIGGVRLKDYCPTCHNSCNYHQALNNIFKEVKEAAYKIIKAKGATYYAIGVGLVKISEAILRDENAVMPISVYLDNYLGIKDVCLSVPTILNKTGVERALELSLDKKEKETLRQSAQAIKKVIKKVGF